MITDFDRIPIDDLQRPHLAAGYLAWKLYEQELTLLLGAGVSSAANLPRWRALVEACERSVGINPPPEDQKRSSTELMQAIDSVRRSLEDGLGKPAAAAALLDLVQRELYGADLVAVGDYPLTVMHDPMLSALGAMVMASARGSVGEVFTLNFDDLLEWYLNLHGFRTTVVSTFPGQVRGNVDVTIFHPHGFLPLRNDVYSSSDWLVLSYSELVDRLGDHGKPWPTLLHSRFLSKTFLAVGHGMGDTDIDIHLDRAWKVLNRSAPLGFVVDVGVDKDRRAALLETGIVPVVLDSYDDIPEFLLGICRAAAGPAQQ